MRLAGDRDVHRADDILELRVEHFGGAAQRGFDAFLVPFDQAVELLQRQRVSCALLVGIDLYAVAQKLGGHAVDAVHEEHRGQPAQIG